MNEESTIIEKLDYLEGTKTSIRNAIIAKGQEVDEEDTFRSYAQKIAAIETGIDTSDATATAEDIKAGKTAYVDGEKIEGIHVDEDLTSVLNAQDEKIAELEVALENKTAAGGNIKFNIYCQNNEPNSKDGLWLKTNNYSVDGMDIKTVDEFSDVGDVWNNIGISQFSATARGGNLLGDYFYAFSTTGSGLKYNIKDNTYSSIPQLDVSDKLTNVKATVSATFNNEIYIFVQENNTTNTYIYKYDVDNETYTYLTVGNVDTLITFRYAVQHKNKIYFGQQSKSTAISDSPYSKYLYSFNTTNNTFSANQTMYSRYTEICETYKGLYIHCHYTANYSTRYGWFLIDNNENLGSVTISPDFSYLQTCNMVSLGDNYIFMFYTTTQSGSASTTYNKTKCTKFDIDNLTFTQVESVAPIEMSNPICFPISTSKIAVINPEGATQIYTAYPDDISGDYDKDTLLIAQDSSSIETKLINTYATDLLVMFRSAYLYSKELETIDNTVAMYYGDGTQWIKFKN